MEISYATLEDVLAQTFGIAAGRRGALVGRLKYFARIGFPRSAKVGRGVRARYGVEDLLDLALALDLTDVGMTPIPIASRIEANAADLHAAFADAWRMSERSPDDRPWWVLSLGMLETMGTADAALDGKAAFLSVVTSAEMRDRRSPYRDDVLFDERRRVAGRRSRILLDPGLLLKDLLDGFGELDGGLAECFADAMGAMVAERLGVTNSA